MRIFSGILPAVSIHLMLLFIVCALSGYWQQAHVSIHLMLLFINRSLYFSTVEDSFNTSHVVVYLPKPYSCHAVFQFQYISCCCLSRIPCVGWFCVNRFNTSHVVVYREDCLNDQYRRMLVSIHLMLLFIQSDVR